jgi:hypothetical protein
MNYAIYRAAADALSERVSAASSALNSTRDHIAAELGIAPQGAMGLTPDAIRTAPTWRAAKLALDTAFSELRRLNGTYAGRFKAEIRAEIAERHRAKVQRSA